MGVPLRQAAVAQGGLKPAQCGGEAAQDTAFKVDYFSTQ